MVARKQGAEPPLSRAFSAWRRLLGHTFGAARRGVSALVTRTGVARSKGWDVVHDAWFAWACGSLLLVGCLVRILVTSPGPEKASAVAAALSAVLWAVARLALLNLATRPAGAEIADVRGAWAAGLAPWVVAVAPGFAVVAWAASAALTLLVLERTGMAPSRARKAVAITWGTQAGMAVAGWLAGNAWVAVLRAGSGV